MTECANSRADTHYLNLRRLKLCKWVLRVRLERDIKDKVLSEGGLLLEGRGRIQETHTMVASRDSQGMMDRDLEMEERTIIVIDHELQSSLRHFITS